MKRALLGLCLLVLSILPTLAVAPPDPDAAIVAGKASLPGLALTLRTDKAQYEQGEPIVVTMRYTYTGTRPLFVEVVNYDRSGRITAFHFTATDAQGLLVSDPTPQHFGLGGLRSATTLTSAKPYEQQVTINEWLRFDKPGRYTIIAHSLIIGFNDNNSFFGGPHIPLSSVPLAIEIIPADAAHRQARLTHAAEALTSEREDERGAAMRDLRFMVDARAIPLLVRGLADTSTNVAYEARFGLRAFPDLTAVKSALLQVIADPHQHIPPDKSYWYASLLAASDSRNDSEHKWETLIAAKEAAELKTATPKQAAEQTVVGLAMGTLPRTDLKNWKRILDNAADMSQASQDYAGALLGDRGNLLDVFSDVRIMRPLIPALKRVAQNTNLSGHLRSGAIVTLHSLGDESLRDLVVADLLLPQPQFSTAAHATLGTYHALKIGQELVRLMASQDSDIQQSAAERLRDFGATVPAAEIVQLLHRDVSHHFQTRDALLETLALKAPAEVLPFLERDLQQPDRNYSGITDTPIRLLCRIDTPAARQLIRHNLTSGSVVVRRTTALALGESSRESYAPNQSGFMRQERHLPPKPHLAASFFPELLQLYQSDPSREVRTEAKDALVAITGIPSRSGYQATRFQEQAWLPQWQSWWHGYQKGLR